MSNFVLYYTALKATYAILQTYRVIYLDGGRCRCGYITWVIKLVYKSLNFRLCFQCSYIYGFNRYPSLIYSDSLGNRWSFSVHHNASISNLTQASSSNDRPLVKDFVFSSFKNIKSNKNIARYIFDVNVGPSKMV